MIWVGVLLGCTGCYLLKLAGLSLPVTWLVRPRLQRIAAVMPVALLSALIGVQTFAAGQRVGFDARVVGLAVAGFAVWRKWPFLVVVGLAAGSTALVRWSLR
ncbi:MAG: AzlD domain-containing protein [Nakamurella sp.]